MGKLQHSFALLGLLLTASAWAGDCDKHFYLDMGENGVPSLTQHLAMIDLATGSKPTVIGKDAGPTSHDPLVRSPDCRWVVAFGRQVFDAQSKVAPAKLTSAIYTKIGKFSPDSRYLFFYDDKESLLFDVVTQKPVALGMVLRDAVFSPDGKTLFGIDNAQSDVLAIDTATRTRKVLAKHAAWSGGIFVSAKNLVFQTEPPAGDPAYWVHDFATASTVELDLKGGFVHGLTPDGASVVYTFVAPAGPPRSLEAIDTNGLNARKLYDFPANVWMQHPLIFSPGSEFVFLKTSAWDETTIAPGTLSISLAGKTAVLSTPTHYSERPPMFSADGKRIAFWESEQTNDKDFARLFSSPLDASTKTKLLEIEEDRLSPGGLADIYTVGHTQTYIRDQNALYYYRPTGDGNYSMHRTDTLSGTTTTVFAPFWDSPPTGIRLAPDGTTLLHFLMKPQRSHPHSRPDPDLYRIIGFDTKTNKAKAYGFCFNCLPYPPP